MVSFFMFCFDKPMRCGAAADGMAARTPANTFKWAMVFVLNQRYIVYIERFERRRGERCLLRGDRY